MDAVCEYCGVEFKKGQHNARYCCKAHRSRSYGRRRAGYSGAQFDVMKCRHCGVEYSSAKLKKYCSDECQKKESSRNGNSVRRTRISGSVSIGFTQNDVIDRDGLNCSHCGVVTSLECSVNSDIRLNIDHIIPISRGGHDALYNAQVLCRKCNGKKGNKIRPVDYDKAESLLPSDKQIEILAAQKKTSKNNKSGVTGVFYDDKKERWIARIERDGKRCTLVHTDSMGYAISIRESAERNLSKGVSINDLVEYMGLRYGKA